MGHEGFSAAGEKCAKGREDGCWLYELCIADYCLSRRIILAKERLCFGVEEELKEGRMGALFGTNTVGSMWKFDEDFQLKVTPWASI